MTVTDFTKKGGLVLVALFLLNAILVAPHKGEFWPFSIYPMFSKAGRTWTRALVRDMTNVSEEDMWKVYEYPELPGKTITTADLGIDNIDFSNFVVKTQEWDSTRSMALHFMIGDDNLKNRKLMAVKVSGRLLEGGGIESKSLPFILFDKNGYQFNPNLPNSEYYKP